MALLKFKNPEGALLAWYVLEKQLNSQILYKTKFEGKIKIERSRKIRSNGIRDVVENREYHET